MPKFRFNHMELSFAKGTLTQQFRDEVDAFYGDVLGWRTLDTEVIGQLVPPPAARRRPVHPPRRGQGADLVARATTTSAC